VCCLSYRRAAQVRKAGADGVRLKTRLRWGREWVAGFGRVNTRPLAQFILHAALDLVDEMQWKTQTTFLRTIDRYNDLFISAMVTHGSVRMLLLHEAKNDEAIRSFFTEVHELYIRVLLNPFYDVNTRIKSPSFDSRVKLIAQSHLRGGNK
jgi:hypothetical protein